MGTKHEIFRYENARPTGQLRLGIFDYLTLMIPRMIEVSAMEYAGLYVDKRLEGYMYYLPLIVFTLLMLLSVVVSTIPRLAISAVLFVLSVPLVALAHGISLIWGYPLKQAIKPLLEDYPEHRNDPYLSAIYSVHVLGATMELPIYMGEGGKLKFNLIEQDSVKLKAIKAFRRLNIGGINKALRTTDTKAQIAEVSTLLAVANVIAQAMRTKTSYFQFLPPELIVYHMLEDNISVIHREKPRNLSYLATFLDHFDPVYLDDFQKIPADLRKAVSIKRIPFPQKLVEYQKLLDDEIAKKPAIPSGQCTADLMRMLSSAQSHPVPHDDYHNEWLVKQAADDARFYKWDAVVIREERRQEALVKQNGPVVEEVVEDERDIEARTRFLCTGAGFNRSIIPRTQKTCTGYFPIKQLLLTCPSK